MQNANSTKPAVRKRFGSEADVERLTGYSRRTLQADRRFKRPRFPWYRVGRKVLYDLNEVQAIIKSNAQGAAYSSSTPAGTEARP